MKKLLVFLLVMSLCVVFATENKVTLKSSVTAGNGIGDVTDAGSSIIDNESKGYWVAMTYTTDNNQEARNLGANGDEIAILTTDTNASGARSLQFQVKFAGNTLETGSTGKVTIATDGWKGTVDAANEDQSVAIALNMNALTTGSATVAAANDNTTSSVSFNVNYPAGLTKAVQVATIDATWTKSDDLKAGDYSATINVTVDGE